MAELPTLVLACKRPAPGFGKHRLVAVGFFIKGFDVDEPEDLIKLVSVLGDEQRPARRALHTLICDVMMLFR